MTAQADVGAASTQFYTDEVAKESYELMPDVLAAKVKDPDLRKLMMTLFGACRLGALGAAVKQTNRSRYSVTSSSAWTCSRTTSCGMCARRSCSSRRAHRRRIPEWKSIGRYCIVWDRGRLVIVDNNWAVGTIVGIWGRETGILGATGRDQVAAMVAITVQDDALVLLDAVFTGTYQSALCVLRERRTMLCPLHARAFSCIAFR